jgi:AcrR family transcriptional regulator
MTTNTIDRRVCRSRALLQHALSVLIRRRSYEAITVDEICATANVGRSTFYAHFRSKDDLKRSGLEELRRSLMSRQRAGAADGQQERFAFSLQILSHARDHLDHYRALAHGRGATVVLEKVRQVVCDLVRSELEARGHRDAADASQYEVTIQYVVGAYMSVLTWWLDSGARLAPERVDCMFRQLTGEGIAAPDTAQLDKRFSTVGTE